MNFFRVTEFAYLFLSSVDINNNIQFSGEKCWKHVVSRTFNYSQM